MNAKQRNEVGRVIVACCVVLMACGAPADSSSVDGAPVNDATVTAGVQRIDLGAVSNGAPVPLMIGPNTLGAQIVVEVDNSSDTETVGIRSVTSPTGEVVVASSAPVGFPLPIGSTSFGIASVTLPQTSATSVIPMVPGSWSVVFDVPAGHTARAHAFVRTTADGEFHGGALDVRIYIPEGLMLAEPGAAHVVTAASAATDPAVAARLDSFFATLASTFQLDRGTVEFLPLPAKFATIDSESERLEALSSTVPFADGAGAHFVWSNEVTIAGTAVWGNSAWIPGLANSPQRWLSGIVVDVATPYPAAADGMTMVHELGHFMGLFHTTELNRSIHDPITDTPECTASNSTCPDGRNIMFVTFYGASGGTGLMASDQQRRVVWGSPLYRAN